MTSIRPWFIALLPLAAACMGDDASTSSATESTSTTESTTTTEGSTTATTTSETTTDGTTTTSTTSSTTTGEPVDEGAARVFYLPRGELQGQSPALRFVEIADGVASAPITVLDAPAGGSLGTHVDLSPGERWLTVSGADPQGSRLWIVDSMTASATEVVVPPTVDLIGSPTFSPDGTVMSFEAGVANVTLDLYTCTITDGGGCSPEIVSPSLPEGASVRDPGAIAADNDTLLYAADLDGGGGCDVMLGSRAAPGDATVVASYPASFTDLGVVAFAADGEAAYYSVDATANAVYEFFAIDLTIAPPGPPVPLHPPIVNDARGRFAPDTSALLLWTGVALHGDLSRIPLIGAQPGAPLVLNTSGPGSAWAGDFAWSADAKRVTYVSDHETPPVRELYIVDASGAPPAPLKVSNPLSAGGVDTHFFLPDQERVIYFAAEADDSGLELYLAGVDQPGAAVKLSAPLPPGGGLSTLVAWSEDGDRILYTGEQEVVDVVEIFFVDLDGDAPAAPVKLNAPLPAGGGVGYDIDFAADGARAFFLADVELDVAALYTVALGTNGQVSAPLVISAPGEDVANLVVLPPAP